MDRYLISGVVSLLILQVLLLLHSLGLIVPLQQASDQNLLDKKVIGRLIQKSESVKRKGQQSIIWEESQAKDILYRYDSILTLDNSTAQLDLEGDVHLKIYENTLVVLEPQQSAVEDSMRVRFFKGQLRSRAKGQSLSVGSDAWSIDAKPGTDMSLRTLANERIELEVSTGQVTLSNKDTGEKKLFNNGNKVTLDKKEIEQVKTVTEEISILNPTELRHYSHSFPVDIPVHWKGMATHLRLLKPDNSEEKIPLKADSVNLSLEPGNYNLSIEDSSGKSSKSITLEIIPAPKIKYLNPLARDRIELGTSYLFSWYPIADIKNYSLNILGESKTLKTKTTQAYINYFSEESGAYNWNVTAYDQEGYVIPAFYSLPVYFTPRPLAAPKLNTPSQNLEKRRPANKKDKLPEEASLFSPLFNFAYDILMNTAWATDPESTTAVVFTWQAVQGADFYTIEISSEADFLKPEVISKTKAESYLWKNPKGSIYYWRVAGGANDGRMGLFSEAEKFDIRNLNLESKNQLGPALQLPVKTQSTAEAKPKVLEAPVIEPKVKKEMPSTFFKLGVRMDYLVMSQDTNDITGSTDFNGFALPSLSLIKSWNILSHAYITDVSYQKLNWTPKNQNTLPYQEDFDTDLIELKIYEHKDLGGLLFGFIAKRFPVIQRKALEQVEATDVTAFGALMRWQSALNTKVDWLTEASIVYGDSYWQPSLTNHLIHPLSKNWDLGGGLEFSAAFGKDSFRAQWMQIGLDLNYSW